jgi:hypothetical protein
MSKKGFVENFNVAIIKVKHCINRQLKAHLKCKKSPLIFQSRWFCLVCVVTNDVINFAPFIVTQCPLKKELNCSHQASHFEKYNLHLLI